jgi:hypothetical protein
MNTTNRQIGNDRLLALAVLLDTADEVHIAKDEPTYCQSYTFHMCGTPACAGGHWNVAQDVRNIEGALSFLRNETFDLSEAEWMSIFGEKGCGNAQTSKEAAEFIRDFVARRINEEKRP